MQVQRGGFHQLGKGYGHAHKSRDIVVRFSNGPRGGGACSPATAIWDVPAIVAGGPEA
jgi:hypothetical protein